MPLNNTRCGNPRLNKSQFVVRRVGFLLFRKGIYEHIFTLQVNFIVEGYKLRLYLHLHLKHISNSVKEMQSIKIQREIICISQFFFVYVIIQKWITDTTLFLIAERGRGVALSRIWLLCMLCFLYHEGSEKETELYKRNITRAGKCVNIFNTQTQVK